MGTCSACGYEITPGDNFCSSCGAHAEPAGVRVSSDTASRPSAAAAPLDDQPDWAGPQFQARHTPRGEPPPPGPGYGQFPSPPPPAGQFPAGSYAPAGGAVSYQRALVPSAAADARRAPAPAGPGAPHPAAVCPDCGQPWAGAQSCTFCGQVWGLPKGIVLASAGRRLGGYLLDGLLVVCTLVIGWLIWTLIVWAQGQSPAKQLLGMRVVRLDTRTHAGWGRMFLRDVVGKFIVWLVASLLLGIGAIVADCWLLWDKDKQELWDKMAGTVVVNDPGRVLAPSPPSG